MQRGVGAEANDESLGLSDQARFLALFDFLVANGLADPSKRSDAASRLVLDKVEPLFHIVRSMPELPKIDFSQVAPTDIIVGILDTETTGNTPSDEVIELAIIELALDRETGAIKGVLDSFSGRREPGVPISAEAEAVHGISMDDVAGLSFSENDYLRIRQIVVDCSTIVAHNAQFDRPYCEKLDSIFSLSNWSCSLAEVDWRERGFGSPKLEFISMSKGFKYAAHGAHDDCVALSHVLNASPGEATPPILELSVFKQPDGISHRIWTINSPFDSKDELKARGYRWAGGTENGGEKAWFKEVPDFSLDSELEWLQKNCYKCASFTVVIDDVTAKDRYSGRRENTRRYTHSPAQPTPSGARPR